MFDIACLRLQRVGTYLGAITTGQNASKALNAALSLFPDQASPSAAPRQALPPGLSIARAAPAHAPAHRAHKMHSPSPYREAKKATPTPTPMGRHLLQVKVLLVGFVSLCKYKVP